MALRLYAHPASRDGVRIHYEAAERGRPVVLLHPNHATAGPLAQMGLHLGASAEEARRQALHQLDGVLRSSSGPARDYFDAVRAVIAAAPLRPVAAGDLDLPILGVAGEGDPFDPGSLYAELRRGGAEIRVEVIPRVGHGRCFVHPDFRRAAVEFVA
jgi:pimeloyl-ACP methyl ester carboxylesterase